jgi:hypothetical protein
MVFAAILSDKLRIADAKANTTDGLSVVHNSYPGACFTKYAPGPADQSYGLTSKKSVTGIRLSPSFVTEEYSFRFLILDLMLAVIPCLSGREWTFCEPSFGLTESEMSPTSPTILNDLDVPERTAYLAVMGKRRPNLVPIRWIAGTLTVMVPVCCRDRPRPICLRGSLPPCWARSRQLHGRIVFGDNAEMAADLAAKRHVLKLARPACRCRYLP